MKNILIFGHSRAGKTTLAKRLKDEFALNIVTQDSLIIAFGQALPQLEIHIYRNPDATTKNVTPFMAEYLCNLARRAKFSTGCGFVADMTFFDFDIGIPIMREVLQDAGQDLLDEFAFIGLDNSKTAEELFADIRTHDTADDWTYHVSDQHLRQHCAENVGCKQPFGHVADALDFKRYDVAGGRKQVFDTIVGDLRSLFGK